MDTPICEFVAKYAGGETLRCHMPGHKGAPLLGMEPLDITEIQGADSLYEADGIIAKSEENASRLFGCRTVYSTEGSSQCIRAMLYLLQIYAKQKGKALRLAAGRNAHKTFLTAAALLDVEVEWLYPEEAVGYLSCNLTAQGLERYFSAAEQLPVAVYVTSPDYLGNIVDIGALAEVCHRYDVLLAVDNAHGAYLRFLPQSRHPMDLGADICCDSAHKTLPALTGGAYLHLSAQLDEQLGAQVKNAMMIFGSTSPSYLILQSLDMVNAYLTRYPEVLAARLPAIEAFRQQLRQRGYRLYGSEPLKLTLDAKACGYRGEKLAELLRQQNVEPEFSDPDYVVLMLSAEAEEGWLMRLEAALCRIPLSAPMEEKCPRHKPGNRKMSIREAMLSDTQVLPVAQCLGKILAVPTVGCPPAVPILVCGEEIDENALECFAYYGIDTCCVVKDG